MKLLLLMTIVQMELVLKMALVELAEQNVVDLDEERKAAMVSNLLVVLCSDKHTQPVVNTGSLYT